MSAFRLITFWFCQGRHTLGFAKHMDALQRWQAQNTCFSLYTIRSSAEVRDVTDTHESHSEDILVLLCVQTTAAAAVLAVDSSSKAVAVQLEALGLLAVAPLWTPTAQHSLFVCMHH